VWNYSLSSLTDLFTLAYRSEEPGNDVFSPHLQVQGGMKNDLTKDPSLFFSL
jgi:hypothetical protein